MVTKETINVRLNPELVVSVEGLYERRGEFEITEINLVEGTALDLISWCDVYNTEITTKRRTLFEIIEEKCVNKINNFNT
jgi:hypothetical protein